MTHFWILFCRSVLEQSCVVWGTSLNQENKNDLERTQKTFCKLVLKEKYKNYENAILKLNLDTLENRRKELILRFAKNGIKKNTLNDKKHEMNKRSNEKYAVDFAFTDRMKNGSVITMQKLLNEDAKNSGI